MAEQSTPGMRQDRGRNSSLDLATSTLRDVNHLLQTAEPVRSRSAIRAARMRSQPGCKVTSM